MTDTYFVVKKLITEIIDKIEYLETFQENDSIDVDVNKYENDYPDLIGTHSFGLEICRICFDTNQNMPIIHPCNCKGAIGALHLVCLERWLAESGNNNCELCGYRFVVKRMPRYNVLHSMWVWLWLDEEEYQSQIRSLRIDIIRCLVVTPLTVVCSYVCMIAVESYSLAYRNGYLMMFILIVSYLIWVYLTTQYHYRIWLQWWKKTNVVKILLPEDDDSMTQEV